MTEENKEDSNKGKCPLAPSDWVMFLDGEINALYSMQGTFFAIVIAAIATVIAAIALCVAFSPAISNADNANAYTLIILLVLFTPITVGVAKTKNTIKKFKNVRNDIIYGTLIIPTKYENAVKKQEYLGKN